GRQGQGQRGSADHTQALVQKASEHCAEIGMRSFAKDRKQDPTNLNGGNLVRMSVLIGAPFRIKLRTLMLLISLYNLPIGICGPALAWGSPQASEPCSGRRCERLP